MLLFGRAKQSKQQVAQLIDVCGSSATAIVEKMFEAILRGEQVDIKGFLEGIDNPLPSGSRYCVVLLSLAGGSDLETELNLARAARLGTFYWRSRTRAYFVEREQNQCIGILCFDGETPMAQIKLALEAFAQYVEQQTDFVRAITWSRAYLELDQIPMYYAEAVSKLNKEHEGTSSEDLTAQTEDTRAFMSEFLLTQAKRHIESAKKYLATRYTDSSLSLEDVSNHVGISKYHLSRLFSKQLEQGFAEYLNQVRVKKAKELLVETNLSVIEISFLVGFNSPQNFGRVFKKFAGITPKEFSKARVKQEEGS